MKALGYGDFSKRWRFPAKWVPSLSMESQCLTEKKWNKAVFCIEKFTKWYFYYGRSWHFYWVYLLIYICTTQRTTCSCKFYSPNMWVKGVRLRPQELKAFFFTHETRLLVPKVFMLDSGLSLLWEIYNFLMFFEIDVE